MTRSDLADLAERLTERDLLVLQDVEKYRLLTTKQIQLLHFDPAHTTSMASARAATRTLSRLRHARVLAALERRIGGARAGSAGFVWYVSPAGERLLRTLDVGGPPGAATTGSLPATSSSTPWLWPSLR